MINTIKKNPWKSSAAAATIAAAVAVGSAGLMSSEGKKNAPYRDIVGVLTVCYGETQGVEMRRYSDQECREMLEQRYGEYIAGVLKCATRPMPRYRLAAFGSLAYNVGTDGVCKSRAMKLHNTGAPVAQVCQAFMAWDMAGGKHVPGLTKRRERERVMCMRED